MLQHSSLPEVDRPTDSSLLECPLFQTIKNFEIFGNGNHFELRIHEYKVFDHWLPLAPHMPGVELKRFISRDGWATLDAEKGNKI